MEGKGIGFLLQGTDLFDFRSCIRINDYSFYMWEEWE